MTISLLQLQFYNHCLVAVAILILVAFGTINPGLMGLIFLYNYCLVTDTIIVRGSYFVLLLINFCMLVKNTLCRKAIENVWSLVWLHENK